MDFGIARVRGAEHVTIEGYMMGTPAYMPPEQVLGHEVDGRADLYSVGVVFYRLLTGALPFKADTAIGMVQKQISDPPTPLHLHRAGLPAWCEAILQRALAKAPADRFQSAEEFRAALAKAAGIVTIGTVMSPLLTPTGTDAHANPALVQAQGAAAAAAAPAGAPERTVVDASPPTAIAGRIPTPVPADLDGATLVIKKKHFALAGTLLAVLAVGVAVLAFVALQRPTTWAMVVPWPGPAAGATSIANAGQAAPAAPAAVIPAATPAAVPVPDPIPEVLPPTPSQLPPADSGKPMPAAAQAARNRGAAAGGADEEPPAESPGRTASRVSRTAPAPLPIAFDAKAMVGNGDKRRERDARVHLADGKVTVVAGDEDVLHSVPYEHVTSVSYSRGRDPLWSSPSGPAPAARGSGGALGFIRGERHWVTLRARNLFVFLRVNDCQVNSVLTAIE
jgi:serine/threonine-protein kinase